MDEERARGLLREERRRLERLLASVDADHDRVAPADEVSEDLVDGADRRTSEETDEAVARQLTQRLQALRRAEGRLAAGTYGRSVLSGRPIPDERLEAFPLAELTVEEEAAQERADRPIVQAVERAADGEDGATLEGEDRTGLVHDRLDVARFGPSREPFQVLDDPAVQDDQLVEDEETTVDEPPPERDPAMPAVPDGVPEDDEGRIFSLPEGRGDRYQRGSEGPYERNIYSPVRRRALTSRYRRAGVRRVLRAAWRADFRWRSRSAARRE